MIFAIIVVFSVFIADSVDGAVNLTNIERVRSKGVLDDRDLGVIDKFVADAVREMMRAEDFTEIAKDRSIILSRNKSKVGGGQQQYSEQFSESSYTHISAALQDADGFEPADRKFKTILNLLILIDGLEDVRLIELSLPKLDSENDAIQYWAVHSITNSGIVKQLNSGAPSSVRQAVEIVEKLKLLVDKCSFEVVSLMVEFATGVQVPQGQELLFAIVDARIKKYINWTVDCELLDVSILRALYDKLSSPEQRTVEIGRRFGQLYSCALQRYIKGRDWLNDTQKQQLASVLVEAEKSYISKLMELYQTIIKRAIEGKAYSALLQEHSRLLGDESQAGQLAVKLGFDYGQSPDGSKRTGPEVLPDPPKREASKEEE